MRPCCRGWWRRRSVANWSCAIRPHARMSVGFSVRITCLSMACASRALWEAGFGGSGHRSAVLRHQLTLQERIWPCPTEAQAAQRLQALLDMHGVPWCVRDAPGCLAWLGHTRSRTADPGHTSKPTHSPSVHCKASHSLEHRQTHRQGCQCRSDRHLAQSTHTRSHRTRPVLPVWRARWGPCPDVWDGHQHHQDEHIGAAVV